MGLEGLPGRSFRYQRHDCFRRGSRVVDTNCSGSGEKGAKGEEIMKKSGDVELSPRIFSRGRFLKAVFSKVDRLPKEATTSRLLGVVSMKNHYLHAYVCTYIPKRSAGRISRRFSTSVTPESPPPHKAPTHRRAFDFVRIPTVDVCSNRPQLVNAGLELHLNHSFAY